MRHKCGAGCMRKKNPSTRRGCPSCGSRRHLEAGGRTRAISQHLLNSRRAEITRRIVAHVLDNWTIRGIRTDDSGRQSWNYLAYLPSLETMVRVAVSMDDNTIISAFADRTANRAIRQGNRGYFNRIYTNLEERDGPATVV